MLLLLVISTITLINVEGVAPPFCELCKCDDNTNNTYDVYCTNNPKVINYLFMDDFWNDTIKTLTVQNIDLPILEEQFPVMNLTKLDLSYNSIAKINHTNLVFANLEKMVELDLSHNELTVLDGEMFRGLRVDGRDYPLRSLRILRISHNILHTLDKDLFQHLDALQVLDISYNPFMVIDQNTEIAIDSMVYLEELYMANTQIAALPEYILHTPKYLRILDLTGNKFTGIPKPLQEAKSLEILYMDQNPIVNLTEEK